MDLWLSFLSCYFLSVTELSTIHPHFLLDCHSYNKNNQNYKQTMQKRQKKKFQLDQIKWDIFSPAFLGI